MNIDLIYEKVLEKIIQEFSGAGAIGGVSKPLGSGPSAGSSGENIYKDSDANDKKHRSKSKKSKQKSVQYYLKKQK